MKKENLQNSTDRERCKCESWRYKLGVGEDDAGAYVKEIGHLGARAKYLAQVRGI